MVLLPKQLPLRVIILWNFCEIIFFFIMFKFYEVTEETHQWIKTIYVMLFVPKNRRQRESSKWRTLLATAFDVFDILWFWVYITKWKNRPWHADVGEFSESSPQFCLDMRPLIDRHDWDAHYLRRSQHGLHWTNPVFINITFWASAIWLSPYFKTPSLKSKFN